MLLKPALALFVTLFAAVEMAAAAEFVRPWRSSNSAIVLDAYALNSLDWSKLPQNKRLTAFINKASDGIAPPWNCKRSDKLCRARWQRYSAMKELFHTRKTIAKLQGMEWGAYHLARPGNPREQALHFLRYAKPGPDDLIALDIEHDDPTKWMSFGDAEIFARVIKKQTGRYPVLYTNHLTTTAIAAKAKQYPLLSRLPLWYARYKSDIRGVFPVGNWESYALWQFSSMVNCNKRRCPMRIKGADNFIDVNVAAMSVAELRKQWPFGGLVDEREPIEPEEPLLLMTADGARSLVASIAAGAQAVIHAYGPTPKVSDAVAALDALAAGAAPPDATPPVAVARVPLPKARPELVAAKPQPRAVSTANRRSSRRRGSSKYTPAQVAAYKRFLKRQAAIRAAKRKRGG